MRVQCEKEINIEELIKDLDIKSKKRAIDEKNSYTVGVNRQLLADARDVIKQLYAMSEAFKESEEVTVEEADA